jgi:DNA mismatch repair protein MutS
MFNAERYITEELKLSEEKIFSAEEKALRLEKQLYSRLIDTMSKYVASIQKTSKAIAELDSLLSFSLAAIKHGFTKPQISNDIKHIKISEGRHPIVEAYLKSGQFVSNDTFLDDKDDRTMILTGPNMAGKSTYMRQVALITLLAHMGSFVPAKSAQIGICDSIFTRIGASDDLAFNQSTFMVEMTEVANILNNASADSLIVLDEIGRGTSTFDGLSIAWSVMEYLSKNIYAKTLFATHYHELTELEGVLEGVKNYHIGIKEIDNTIIFLHKIMRGGESKSFGIEVAALAGLPKTVIDRAKEILQKLDAADINKNKG